MLVKFPSLPLSLIWLSPNETMDPALAFMPVPLPPIVDEPTLIADPAVLVWTPVPKLSTMLNSSTVKKTWLAPATTPALAVFSDYAVAYRPRDDAGTTEKKAITHICHQLNPVQRHRRDLTARGVNCDSVTVVEDLGI